MTGQENFKNRRNSSNVDALLKGKLDVVKKGIEEEGFGVDMRDPSENDTALIKAAYWARYDICEYLLSKGADINAVDNSMGFTGTFSLLFEVRG
tara:strand:+ start:426 stop:707 length:282 start_codon:yes stop_codon:yes gene_type:complete